MYLSRWGTSLTKVELPRVRLDLCGDYHLRPVELIKPEVGSLRGAMRSEDVERGRAARVSIHDTLNLDHRLEEGGASKREGALVDMRETAGICIVTSISDKGDQDGTASLRLRHLRPHIPEHGNII